MTTKEIVKALLEHAEWADAREYETPICLGDDLRAAVTCLERQEQRIAELEKDLRHNDNCDICIGSMTVPAECDCDCLTCSLDCRCKDCTDENKWAWRGARKGENRNV